MEQSMHLRKTVLSSIAVAALSLTSLVAASSSASAYVVCNREGDCWHTDHRWHYGPYRAWDYHPDDWYFHRHWEADHNYRWREYHEGRGYWRGGVWIQL